MLGRPSIPLLSSSQSLLEGLWDRDPTDAPEGASAAPLQPLQVFPAPAPPASVAAAAPGHHVIVLLEDHVLIIVEVEEVDGEELVGHTAGAADALAQLQGVDDGLHCGVVGRPHVLTQREGAGAFAVEGVVPPW